MDPKEYGKAGIREIEVRSTSDGFLERCLFWRAPGSGPRPLLVGLHTWSSDRHNQADAMLPLAKRNAWHLLLPECRGPNLVENPRASQACASRLAMQDVVDAIESVAAANAVDRKSIFLLGVSGGGHMAMMMAGYRPMLWRSVGAFCGIADLESWHRENPSYSKHIAACCGGAPSDRTRAEYRARSPITHVNEIAQSELTIYHGKYDKSVPFTHSMRIYMEICRVDPQARVFLNIFDGGHEMLLDAAERQFLASMSRHPDT
jgi:pimeloyl-ACP methyl ester carboxylesterase